ncbi:hypothetical protein MRX96_004480 [Rhipicephalus microplus]
MRRDEEKRRTTAAEAICAPEVGHSARPNVRGKEEKAALEASPLPLSPGSSGGASLSARLVSLLLLSATAGGV